MSEQIPVQPGGIATPDPDEVASRSFPTARRGFEPDAVRRFLAELAERLRTSRRAEQSLIAELAATRSGSKPSELSDAALSNAVGAETARVLTAAHEAAHDIVTKAERRASALMLDAETAFAERSRIAEAEATDILARSRAEAASFLESTRQQCRAMVDEARDARRRILADLVDRRRSLHVQLEQLRAGRDSLSEMVNSVSGSVMASVEAVRARLDRAEQQARIAATDAGRHAALQDDALELDALVEGDLDAASLEALVGPLHDEVVFAPVAEVLSEPEAPEASRPSPAPGVAIPEDAALWSEEVAGGPAADDTDAGDALDATSNLTSDPGAENPIDQLFARIRASRDEELAHAHAVLSELADDPERTDVPDAAPADEAETQPEASAALDSAPEPVEPDAEPEASGAIRQARARRGTRRGGEAQSADVATPESPETEGDSDEFAILVRRDQLLGPPTAELGRSLKRALRLEQNELLDALRNTRKAADRANLLPGDAMADRLVEASTKALAAAYGAGLTFVTEVLGAGGEDVSGSGPVDDTAVREIANALAREVVEPIRRRVDSGLDEGGDEEGASGAVVGAAFRDWRGSRVEGVAGDFVAHAFASATRAGASSNGVLVSWLVDDGESRCPDCDDNALAGAQTPGEPFPTGHVDPPIHPGCRCVLVPLLK